MIFEPKGRKTRKPQNLYWSAAYFYWLLCQEVLIMERANESEKTFRKGDSGPKYLMRGPKIDWGVIALNPGEKMGVHGHNAVEETFFFIQGAPKIIIDDVSYDVKEGDAFRLEPLEKHDIHNDTDSPVKFVFIKCPYLPDDKITY